MHLLLRLLFVVTFLVTSGCEVDRVLTVKRDGSGTIYERFLAARDSYSPAEGAREQKGDAANQASPTLNLTPGIERPSAEAAAKKGAEFGGDVKVVSYRQIEEADMLGYEVTYQFPDITKIRIDSFVQGPGNPAAQAAVASDPSHQFQFTKGDICELVAPLKFTRDNSPAKPGDELAAKRDPDQEKKFLEAMKHFRMYTAIKVDGSIKETNAQFRDGNVIVLSEMNAKGFLEDPKNQQMVKDIESGKTMPPSEEPKDPRYFKDETVDVLKIRFQ